MGVSLQLFLLFAHTLIMKKNKLLSGVVLLSVFGLLAKAVGAIYRIPLTHILTSEGMGLYQMVFPLYSLLLALSSSGFPASISKLVSGYNARNEQKKAKSILNRSLSMLLIFSSICALLVLLFGTKISALQGNSEAGILYIAIAPAIVLVGVISAYRGYFQGYENMMPSSVSLLIEQVGKLGAGILLAKILGKYGVVFATLGAILGVVVSEILCLMFLMICYFLQKRKQVQNLSIGENLSKSDARRQILSVVVPITIGGIIMPISMFIDSTLVVNLLTSSGFSSKYSTSLFGLSSGVVGSIVNMPVVFSAAITTSLLPLASKAFSKGNKRGVEKNISLSLIMNFVIILPMSIVVFFFSDMIINFLYSGCLSHAQFETSSLLLKFGAFSVVYLSIVQISTTALQSIGKTIVPVFSLFLGVVLKIILTVILVKNPTINIYGMMIASCVCYAVAGTINLIVLLKNVKFMYARDLTKCLVSNILFASACVISKKVVQSFSSGRLSLVLAVLGLMVVLGLVYYVMYKKEVNTFLMRKIKVKKQLNKT